VLDITDALQQTVRTSRRRRRNGQLAGIALAVALAVAGVAAVPGLLPDRASKVTGTLDQSPSSSPSASASSAERLYELTADPLLTHADWVRLTDPRDTVPVLSDIQPPTLTTCISSPLTWQARQSHVATYVDSTKPAAVWNEYVLTFDEVEQARQAVGRVWQQMVDCPTPPVVFVDGLSEQPQPGPTGGVIDEAFAAQRTTFTTVSPGDNDMPIGMYALRVARRGNVVVVLEDEGYPTDRAWVIMTMAIDRAIASD
jgi:hypothetical protein